MDDMYSLGTTLFFPAGHETTGEFE